MRKSDVLFLIVGTNPMPNILAIENRVKENGEVFLICSKGGNKKFSTESIGNKIKKIFLEKYKELKIETIMINMQDEKSMIREVERIYKTKDKSIELNYTGGTKLISSTIYGFLKNKMKENKNVISSYIDCDKELFIYESLESNKTTFKEEAIKIDRENRKITLKDIIVMHELGYHKEKTETSFEDISYKLFNNFEKLKLHEKLQWVEELNLVLSRKEKNKKAKILDFLARHTGNMKIDEIGALDEKSLIKYILGDAFEEYFFRILSNLKEEEAIDEFKWSYEQNKSNEMAQIEIDFLIIKGSNNYLLSVTLCEEEYACKPKLYEAKMRSEQISGDETRVGYICLYKDYKELERLILADNKYSKDLIIAIDNFYDIESKIKNWIKGERA